MATSSCVKNCAICKEVYDEGERCPRGLPCMHCLCTSCAVKLIDKNDKRCPFCRQPFVAASVQDLKRNVVVLDFLEYIKNLKDEPATTASDQTCSRSKMVNGMKKSCYKKCKKNLESLSAIEESIENIIKGNNTLKQNNTESHLKKLEKLETIFNFKQKFLDVENGKLDKKLCEIKKQKQKLVQMNSQLDAITRIAEIDDAIDEVEALHKSVQPSVQSLEEDLPRMKNVQKQMEKNATVMEDKLDSMLEVLTSEHEENDVNHIMQYTAVNTLLSLLEKETTLRTSNAVMDLASAGKVFGVQTHFGTTRYAKFTMSDNKLCLHSLKEQEVPADSHKIDHGRVVGTSDYASGMVFLEFSDNRKHKLGRIYIRLFPNSKRATQFAYLCSGEKGPSFLNTNLHKINWWGKPMENIMFGDYEKRGGKGGKALIPGVWEEKSEQRKLKAGIVRGVSQNEAMATQCVIMTKTDESFRGNCFGMVEEGLHIIQEAVSKYPDMQRVFISDVGIVLNV